MTKFEAGVIRVLKRYFAKSLVVAAAVGVAVPAQAMLYDFSLTWDGTAYSVNSGATDPVGTNIAIGDSFTYDLNASANHAWQVVNGGSFFPFLAFSTSDAGDRTASISLELLNNGVSVFSLSDPALVHGFVHMGTNAVTLATGLEFDRAILNYVLSSSDTGDDNHITSIAWPSGTPFGFFSPDIQFVETEPETVPEPATLTLAMLAIAGAAATRRRARLKQ